MSLNQIDFSKVLRDDVVFEKLMANYNRLGKSWIDHQWRWMNAVYQAFNDHYKYLIIISLVEKTLHFYDQMNVTLTYDQYYSKSELQIDKFSISELCEKLQLPKETVRRKVLELEELGVLKRSKKKIIIDRSSFSFIKPQNQMKYTSKYVVQIAEILNKEKIFSKKINSDLVEDVLKRNFSITWRWFYRMQIPIVIGYHDFFGDLTTFHIWGTVCMNQAFNYTISLSKKNIHNDFNNNMNLKKRIFKDGYLEFNEQVVKGNESSGNGVSAMSVSDMTGIPRATVVRKCKFLIKSDYLKLNEKKQYVLTGLTINKILPYQKKIFRDKAKFLRKLLNLILIS